MSIRDDFFAAQAKASLWDVAVSIKRGNPLPLDANAVYNAYGEATVNGDAVSYTAGSLLEYAKTNPVAYPGQICAVVGVDATTIYYLDQNLDIQPVGIIPTGDNKTIEVTAQGAISLFGAATAPNGTLPMIDAETGKLVWRTLEDIGAGDGNDNTTYEFDFADQKIIVTPKFNGQPIMEGEGEEQTQVKYELDLSDFITSGELTTAIANFATTSYVDGEVEKLEKAISEIDFVDEDELATALEPYAKTADVNAELAKKAALDDFNTLKGRVDAFFEGTGVENVIDTLEDLINYINTHDDADISGILASIQALENKVDTGDKTVSAYVTAAIDALSIGDYAKAEDLTKLAARVKALEDVDNFTQAEFDTFNTANSTAIEEAKNAAIDDAATKYAPKTTVYTKGEIDELLEGIQGGASESAASVNTKLENYKKVVNAEVWGDEAGAGDAQGNSRIDLLEAAVDALEAVGAQANVIEEVKGAADNRLSVSTVGKVVTIDDANLRTDIAAAKKAGDDAQSAANTNAQAITNHDGRISALETAKTTQGEQIAALLAADETLGGKILALETTVNNETSGVAANYAATVKNAADIATLLAQDKTHGDDIAALKTTTAGHGTDIQNINAALENVYTKNDVYTKTEVNTTVAGINESLAKKLEAEALAPYAKTEDIAKVYATIEALNAVSGDLAKEIARADAAEKVNAKAIADEIARATGVEADHEARIAEVETFFAAVEEPDEVINTLAEIVSYIESDKTGAAELTGKVNQNTTDIANLTTRVAANEKAVGETLPAAIAQALVDAKKYADDQDAVTLAAAKKYTDDTMVKADGTSIENVDGTFSVKAVSTDKLVQGSEEFILFGGHAVQA